MKFTVRCNYHRTTGSSLYLIITAISEGGGTIWTQLILMTQSPIIGLSATVGDAVAFNTWLEGVQNAHGTFLVR